MTIIEEMLDQIDILFKELSNRSSIKDCIPIQEKFTEIVEYAMNAFKQGKISVDVKALPLPMYFWATEELPQKIQAQENLKEIQIQLKLFKNSILHILNPKEE